MFVVVFFFKTNLTFQEVSSHHHFWKWPFLTAWHLPCSYMVEGEGVLWPLIHSLPMPCSPCLIQSHRHTHAPTHNLKTSLKRAWVRVWCISPTADKTFSCQIQVCVWDRTFDDRCTAVIMRPVFICCSNNEASDLSARALSHREGSQSPTFQPHTKMDWLIFFFFFFLQQAQCFNTLLFRGLSLLNYTFGF